MGSTPGSGRSPEGGNGNPLQYSCLENLMDKGGYIPQLYSNATFRSIAESDMTEHTHTHTRTRTRTHAQTHTSYTLTEHD